MPQSVRRILGRATSGLRVRLTLTYVLFIGILLGFLGITFTQTIRSLYDAQFRALLDEEWAAVRGYLRIDKPKKRGQLPEAVWYYDRDDPEEALIVDRLRQVYLLADAAGRTLEVSSRYRQLPVESPEDIRRAVRSRSQAVWKTVHDAHGTPYMVRVGVMIAEDDQPYYISIARSMEEEERILREFSWYYGWLSPLIIVSAAVLGWFMARRALVPVNELAATAERITSSNLAVQIPQRGANDELDKLIESFNRMIERLNESFIQTRQFSTDVSHELRTPLTAIRGQLEVALLAAKTPEQYQEAILNALQDVERLSKTIRALLLLSQAESGQVDLQKQLVEFDDVVADIVEQFQIPAEGAHVTLRLERRDSVWMMADRIQIERLVSNLLSNAVKYTPAGGEVSVSVYRAGEWAQFLVSDTGVGISPDHLPYIFDRFYRVPSHGRQKSDSSPERGLGLGLSFVAWIVRAHGGHIDVNSTPGKGSTFHVRLPVGPMPEPEQTEPGSDVGRSLSHQP